MSRWAQYVEITKNRKPSAYIDRVVALLGEHKGDALDLGCGAGVDARYLAQKGFAVEAIDDDNASIVSTKELCRDLPVSIIKKDIKDFTFQENRFNIVLCRYVLPFLGRGDAERILKGIQEALIPKGVFIFGLIGPEDDWMKTGQARSSFKPEELKIILDQMDMVVFDEVKENGKTAAGQSKFWHKIEGIARKR